MQYRNHFDFRTETETIAIANSIVHGKGSSHSNIACAPSVVCCVPFMCYCDLSGGAYRFSCQLLLLSFVCIVTDTLLI